MSEGKNSMQFFHQCMQVNVPTPGQGLLTVLLNLPTHIILDQ